MLILSKSEVSVVGSVSGSFGLDLELFDFKGIPKLKNYFHHKTVGKLKDVWLFSKNLNPF